MALQINGSSAVDSASGHRLYEMKALREMIRGTAFQLDDEEKSSRHSSSAPAPAVPAPVPVSAAAAVATVPAVSLPAEKNVLPSSLKRARSSVTAAASASPSSSAVASSSSSSSRPSVVAAAVASEEAAAASVSSSSSSSAPPPAKRVHAHDSGVCLTRLFLFCFWSDSLCFSQEKLHQPHPLHQQAKRSQGSSSSKRLLPPSFLQGPFLSRSNRQQRWQRRSSSTPCLTRTIRRRS